MQFDKQTVINLIEEQMGSNMQIRQPESCRIRSTMSSMRIYYRSSE